MKKQINEVKRMQKIAGILNENEDMMSTQPAYAIVIDEDGDFIMKDLATYAEESYIDATSDQFIPAEAIQDYPMSVDAWQHSPDKAESENMKWKQVVAKLGGNYDYYDVIGDGGENAVVAAVPKGKSPEDYVQDDEDDDY